MPVETHHAYIALGSNIEPRREFLNRAIKALDRNESTSVVQKSHIYETVPKGYADQADFLNMVLEVETTCDPFALLGIAQQIEDDLNRVRTIKNGPRTIDVDLLAYEDQTIDHEILELPHPRIQERAFVLFPMAEIAADFVLPGTGQTIQALRDALPEAEKADVRIYE